MDKVNTSDRLKQIMSERHLRQVDILEMCRPYCELYNVRLDKSHLSQYVKGTILPKQDKLTMLSMALGVNEVWLMGYDVPPERTEYTPELSAPTEIVARSTELDSPLYRKIERLDDIDKAKTEGFVDALLLDSKYQPKAKEA